MGKWDRLLCLEHILVGLQARRNLDAIRELATALQEDEAIQDPKALLAGLMRREREGWTCIGKGVAIPHVHEDSIRSQRLAIGISREGIDFSAPDGEPVRLIALLATPKKHQTQHLELLASLSRLLQNDEVRQQLVQAADAAAVMEIFKTSSR